MSRQHYVEQTVGELGAALDIPQLALDSSGRASLSLNGIRLTLCHADDPVELLWLFVDLGEVADDSAELLQGLLQMGFLTWSSNCMTIGIDESGERIIGHSNIPVVFLNAVRLRDLVQRMLESAAAIRQRIESRQLEFTAL